MKRPKPSKQMPKRFEEFMLDAKANVRVLGSWRKGPCRKKPCRKRPCRKGPCKWENKCRASYGSLGKCRPWRKRPWMK